ncbi:MULTISPECIES: GMC oxidoreductase [Dickeya]|uniref:GMC family oxidoreductase n=1 Tax=Dickeya fangzhongdai TaxID=1778540 RepID=A0A2K8QI53_9GAMM|nr:MULTISPECIES: GMC family oxidoreductase [Dickeya]ATZ93187.1 GMC family oxidoreductase [Dickeya fangzhongdai]QOH46616.1 GMC family oxidoreductase [Dickeya fangzhongdai]QOH50923.1 GMC family oxidoreductase [Dickeya fangzhongdai]UGA51697.1 GMC family oxidoreductase [Dickeya fangzhongdai]UWH08045.1 GMC family oxidoreductase [Dickeya fangzhongdai]
MRVDTLIIGSGIAAAALSQRLLDHDPHASILLLEAGGRVKMQDYNTWTTYLVNGKLPYEKYYDLPYPERDHPGENLNAGGTEIPLAGARALTYGGSTIHWGGWSFRLKPEDFFLHSNTGESIDWPFDYHELEPYYCAAEHYIGVSGDSHDPTVPRSAGYPFPAFPYTLEDQPMATAMESLGIGYSHVPIARHGMTDTVSRHAPCQTTGTCKYCPFGARYAATNFLNDMQTWENHENFHIRTNVIVEKILMDGKQSATGVECVDKEDGQTEVIHAKRIIVAAGTIESAKLLLRSTSTNWPGGLGNQHDLVGRNFITHPYFIFTANLPDNPQALQPEMNFPTLCSRHFDSPEEQAKGKFMLINPPGSPLLNLAQQMQNGLTREKMDAYVSGPTQIQLHGMLEVFSRYDNRILNFNKINHLGMEETLVDYTKDATFDQRMMEIQSHVNQLFGQIGATLAGKPSISWRADHAACVTRMSHDEKQGVVDPHLRIHGTDNVYVCSNAVFPSTGAINPTLTLTALSLRLADHLHHRGL